MMPDLNAWRKVNPGTEIMCDCRSNMKTWQLFISIVNAFQNPHRRQLVIGWQQQPERIVRVRCTTYFRSKHSLLRRFDAPKRSMRCKMAGHVAKNLGKMLRSTHAVELPGSCCKRLSDTPAEGRGRAHSGPGLECELILKK